MNDYCFEITDSGRLARRKGRSLGRVWRNEERENYLKKQIVTEGGIFGVILNRPGLEKNPEQKAGGKIGPEMKSGG